MPAELRAVNIPGPRVFTVDAALLIRDDVRESIVAGLESGLNAFLSSR